MSRCLEIAGEKGLLFVLNRMIDMMLDKGVGKE